MPRTYHHISSEQRAGIMPELRRGARIREIARALDRAPSTISREVRRGGAAAVRQFTCRAREVGLNSMPGLAENRRTERLNLCCEDLGALEFLALGAV